MRRILLIGSGIFLGIIILTGLATVFWQRPSVGITARVVAPDSLGGAVSFGADTALLSDGSQFMAYNYVTGDARAVSVNAGTDGLVGTDSLAVSGDRHYILFHQTAVVNGSAPARALQERGWDITQDYWWVYSLSAQTFQPLPAGTLIARFANDHIYALGVGSNGETITGYAPDSLKQLSSVGIIPSADFAVTPDGYLLQDTDNTIYATKDGVINRQLTTDATLVAATGNGGQVIITRGESKNLTLQQIDTQTGKTTTLASHVTNQPRWQSSGLILYNTSYATGFVVYDLTDHKATSWRFGKNIYPGGTAASLLDKHTAVIADTSGSEYLVGTGLYNPVKL